MINWSQSVENLVWSLILMGLIIAGVFVLLVYCLIIWPARGLMWAAPKVGVGVGRSFAYAHRVARKGLQERS